MWKVVKKVLDLSEKLAVRIRWGFFFSFVDAIFEVAPFAAIIYVFLQIQNKKILTSSDSWICAGILIVGIIGRILFKYLVYRYQSATGYAVIAKQRIIIGDRLRRVPMGFFNKNSLGEITTTVTTDLNFLEMYAMHILDKVVNGFISVLVMSIFLFLFDWRMGIVFLIGLFASMFVYRAMQKQMIAASMKQKQAQAEVVAATLEYVQGISVIKSFNLTGEQARRAEKAFTKHSEASYYIEKTFIPLFSLYSICFKIACGVILVLAPMLAISGEMTLVKMLTAVIATFTLYTPIEIMGSLTSMVRLMEASLNRVERVKNVPLIDEGVKTEPLSCYDIAFENVFFSYDGKENVIKDLSFIAPENSMTAIVGASGCGKTTVTRLIARFWDVQCGSVKVGGVDVKDMSCDGLLQNISMVFQNVYLFNDTIENNIKFGRPNASHEQVVEVSKKARCHDFIMELPNKYNTMLGENGANLSGGERQRISIARAILKDAPIILLDEATASVDPENENYIQRAINELVKNKTLVVIAHRLSTVRNADQIIVMDEGRLTESGTHEELLSRPGIYNNFWQIRQDARNWKINQK
ncbi:ABC transporter ATP-binding protein [Clostridium sp. 'deep sea']|uniref:ABC transporter ATP-binding protein n=1 Tax=Clostridium sp. 'deep sea' TaxID=2779445 RepID=UPI001896921F|nr:ABC transporter ATP-binding protein [Clostridium sp. 'deep sea']QOR35200.1 ABC transporter ATP-binding protein [Clostridium sp. 'deep sea']